MKPWRVLRRQAAPLLVAGLLALALRGQNPEELRVTVGKSVVLDYPADIARISTSNPDVVDAVAVSTREILLHAKGHGTATVVVWARSGERSFYTVTVEHNLAPIRQLLEQTFPGEEIHLASARDSVTLTGAVSSQEVSDRAAALVASLAKTVVNHLRVRPPAVDKQILLRVKFAELDRDATSQFGASIVSTGATNTVGRLTTGQFGAATPDAVEARGTSFRITDALNVFAFRPDLDLAAFLKLLESQALLQVLAEPNLVTSDGKEASFLVGGEFPVPVLQGGAMAGAVTVQFREFGIRLHFTPQITPNGTIRMFVRPEVSTIDLMNAISIGGLTIPALATRRTETHIELAERQSFVIAGLIDDRVRATFSQIPGLASIPILGELFKSREKKRSKSELLVMVTPEIVRPLEPGEPAPEIDMPIEFLERFKRGQRMGYDGRLKGN